VLFLLCGAVQLILVDKRRLAYSLFLCSCYISSTKNDCAPVPQYLNTGYCRSWLPHRVEWSGIGNRRVGSQDLSKRVSIVLKCLDSANIEALLCKGRNLSSQVFPRVNSSWHDGNKVSARTFKEIARLGYTTHASAHWPFPSQYA
jgi:hypothetical protein